MSPVEAAPPRPGPLRRLLRTLGPGLITGTADDDPCAIATYSQAGAAFGFGLLWMPLFILPFLVAVQLMCARIGVVARRGLAGVLREHYPPPLLWIACALLAIANTIALAADLGGMAAAGALLTGLPAGLLLPAFAVAVLALVVFGSYGVIVRIFKWLALALLAYVAAGLLAEPDWGDVALATFVPHLSFDARSLETVVAVFGCAISPYLYFWQTAQVVEHEALDREADDRVEPDRRHSVRPRPAGRRIPRPAWLAFRGFRLRLARVDVLAGMSVAMLITYFIILTAGATLHASGQEQIATAEQAAAALRPVAGAGASALFAIGLLGTGAIGIPVLAGSAAYAIAEAGAWRRGLDRPPASARRFYGVIVVAVLIGAGVNYLQVDPVRMLFFASVVNGVLAPPLLVLILLVSNNRTIMQDQTNGPVMNLLGITVAVLMAAAAAGLLIGLMA